MRIDWLFADFEYLADTTTTGPTPQVSFPESLGEKKESDNHAIPLSPNKFGRQKPDQEITAIDGRI